MNSKFLTFINNRFCDIQSTLKRFTGSFLLASLLFMVMSYVIVTSSNKDIFKEVFVTLISGYIICAFFQILYEKVLESRFKIKNFKLIYDISCILLSLSSFLLVHFYFKSSLFRLGFAGVNVVEILLILYFSGKDYTSKSVSHLIKGMSFNTFVCSIFFVGVSICLMAFNTLVLHDSWSNFSKYFSVLGFLTLLIYQIMSLSILPKNQQEFKVSQLFNITISNLVLPIYLLLLFVLYIYLGRILVRGIFPSNEVNWFVSISSLLFIFLSFALMHRKEESKFIDLFLKFGGLLVIPTILMQFVSMYIRFSEYGLTSTRYLSIVLNIFSLIFTILVLIRKERGLKESLLILSALVILITLTPLNIFNTPIIEQQHRLKKLLLINDMLVDNHIVKKSEKEISSDQGDKIIESYLYIKNNRHFSNVKCNFISEEEFSFPASKVHEVFGFSGRNGYTLKKTMTDDVNYLYFSYSYNQPMNVRDYKEVYRLKYDQLYIKDSKVFCKIDGDTKLINGFYDYIQDFFNKNNINNNSHGYINEQIEYEYENYKFIILRGNLLSKSEKLELNVSEGYLLKK